MSDDHIIDRDGGPPLAAEYVLGVLNADERRAFALRLAREPALRTEVEYWERRLGGLAAEVKPIEPPPQTWSNIESAQNQAVAAPAHSGVWNSLAFWRWAAIGSAAVAAASIAALMVTGPAAPPNLPLIAKLDVSGGQAGFVAALDPARNGLTIVPASVTNVNQRVLELWLILPGATPRSLGLIGAGRAIHINLPADLSGRIAADATLAVSVEPPGGSPTGQPTGPVIANGKLTNL
jgi:anti-sigma-K factor RskA